MIKKNDLLYCQLYNIFFNYHVFIYLYIYYMYILAVFIWSFIFFLLRRIVRHSFPDAAIPSRGAIIFRIAGSFSFPFFFFFYNWTGRKNRRVRKAVRVDRTEIHGDSRRGDDLPRNRSTCSWHQKPMLTTSNNSSKLSVLSLTSLNRKDSRYTALTDVHTPPCVARYIKYVLALGILVSRALWFPGN